MNEAIKIATDPRAVVLYQRETADGKQQIEVRTGKGVLLETFRHVRGLAGWIRGKKYNFYEYNALSTRTRKALDNWRAGYDQENKPEQPQHPSMGDLCPQLHLLRHNG